MEGILRSTDKQYDVIVTLCIYYTDSNFAKDKLACIRAFLAMVDTGRFTRAARKCGVYKAPFLSGRRYFRGASGKAFSRS